MKGGGPVQPVRLFLLPSELKEKASTLFQAVAGLLSWLVPSFNFLASQKARPAIVHLSRATRSRL